MCFIFYVLIVTHSGHMFLDFLVFWDSYVEFLSQFLNYGFPFKASLWLYGDFHFLSTPKMRNIWYRIYLNTSKVLQKFV
jgi:hypothetical protein